MAVLAVVVEARQLTLVELELQTKATQVEPHLPHKVVEVVEQARLAQHLTVVTV
jgi:hypothetical protein